MSACSDHPELEHGDQKIFCRRVSDHVDRRHMIIQHDEVGSEYECMQ